MVDIEKIQQKYCMDDDLSKAVNAQMHTLKQKGLKIDKGKKANMVLRAYIKKANATLGRNVQIYEKINFDSPNPTFGINWASSGTVSVPETKRFIQKLQQAIDFIQKAPKASGDMNKIY